jgi:hypothetical protein
MRFYTKTGKLFCRNNLHAGKMCVCIIDGEVTSITIMTSTALPVDPSESAPLLFGNQNRNNLEQQENSSFL